MFKTVFRVFLFFIVSTQMVFAGPVNRELIRRADDVPTPKARPSGPSKSNIDASTLKQSAIDQEGAQTAAPLIKQNTAPIKTPSVKKKTEQKVPATVQAVPTVSNTPPRTTKTSQHAVCLQKLQKIAQASSAPHPTSKEKACIIPNPVILKATQGPYPIQFTKGLTLDCEFALKLAQFSSQTVQALARHHIGSPLVSIQSGQGYVCRRRNNKKTGKLSDHAFGNALDWLGFRFQNKESFSIKSPSLLKTNQAAFFTAMRRASCGTFTTVLGPGANAAHATHLHVDLARSKDKKNPYRICE